MEPITLCMVGKHFPLGLHTQSLKFFKKKFKIFSLFSPSLSFSQSSSLTSCARLWICPSVSLHHFFCLLFYWPVSSHLFVSASAALCLPLWPP